jgi:hypothetical protein
MPDDDTIYYELDALNEELDSALRHLVQALIPTRDLNDIAWWLCANHPKFVAEDKQRRTRLQAMAEKAGTPPRGKNWDSWFTRIEAARCALGEKAR